MSESASIPAFMFAMFAIGIAVERPTPVGAGGRRRCGRRRLWSASAGPWFCSRSCLRLLLLASRARLACRSPAHRSCTQAKTLLAARSRTGSSRCSPFSPTAVSLPADRSASTGRVATTHYDPLSVALWTARHAGEAVLAVGVAPACAFLLLLATALTRGLPGRAERAFVATAAASVLLFLLQTGAYASAFNSQILERYSLYAFPPLLIAFVLWLARGLPRPRPETLFATISALALVSLILFGALLRPDNAAEPVFASLTLHLFRRVPQHTPGGLISARILLFAVAALVALLFARAPARFLRAALPAGVAALLLLASHAAYGSLVSEHTQLAELDRPDPKLDRRTDRHLGRKGCLSVCLQPVGPGKLDRSREHTVLESIARRHLLVRRQGTVPASESTRCEVDERTGALVDSAHDSVKPRAIVTDRGLAVAGKKVATGGSYHPAFGHLQTC